MANTPREKELKTEWPITEGLTAGTTRQRTTSPYLEAEESSNVETKDKTGMD